MERMVDDILADAQASTGVVVGPLTSQPLV
jgi:hypothetical protein